MRVAGGTGLTVTGAAADEQVPRLGLADADGEADDGLAAAVDADLRAVVVRTLPAAVGQPQRTGAAVALADVAPGAEHLAVGERVNPDRRDLAVVFVPAVEPAVEPRDRHTFEVDVLDGLVQDETGQIRQSGVHTTYNEPGTLWSRTRLV